MKGNGGRIKSNNAGDAFELGNISKTDETSTSIEESLELGQLTTYIPPISSSNQTRVAAQRQARMQNTGTGAKDSKSEDQLHGSHQQGGNYSMARMDVVEWPLRDHGAKICDLG